MTARLDADPAYSGFICKNPLHRCWATLWGDHLYSLGELHGWLGNLHQYQLPTRKLATGINIERQRSRGSADWPRGGLAGCD